MTSISYRLSVVGDAADIFAVLQENAEEIPLVLDTLAREEAIYARVRNWARSGESWVADEDGHIVGFLLAELNQSSRFWGEHEVIDVHYTAVAKSHRNRGIFTELMRRVLNRLVPVTIAVSPGNRSSIVQRLRQLGFRSGDPAAADHRFLWDPTARSG